MVAKNPLFVGWSLRKFKATVINDIWPEVLFFSLIALMVTLVTELTPHSLNISNQVLTVLGTVLGLVISFRTSSAYERYMEGRKLWTNIEVASRSLAQVIWIHIPVKRFDKTTKEELSTVASMIEKKTMINLVQAFSVAVKHMLRGEAGVYYKDLYPLVCYLPRYATAPPASVSDMDMLPLWVASNMDSESHSAAHTLTAQNSFTDSIAVSAALKKAATEGDEKEDAEFGERPTSWYNSFRKRSRRHKDFDPEKALPFVCSEHPLRPARNPPEESIFDYLPFLRIFKVIGHWIIRRPMPAAAATPTTASRSFTGKKIKPEWVDSNVPMEITLFLSSYLAWVMENGYIQAVLASSMQSGIASFQDTVANLERIRNTPLPFAYQAHLRISLWIYLFFLPFQIVTAFGYLTIPATAFSAFLLVGFLEIGQEIENPFNYDMNDLDLDQFCLTIQRELHEITAHTAPSPSSYIFSSWNQPFAPADRRNAAQMMNDVNHVYHGPDTGMHHMRRTLLKSWRDVDEITRH